MRTSIAKIVLLTLVVVQASSENHRLRDKCANLTLKEEELMYENYYEKNFGFESRLILQKFSDDHISGDKQQRRYYGTKYIIVNAHETYDNAQRNCKRYVGGDLAGLATKEISDQLDVGKLKGMGKFWVGARKKIYWKWINHSDPLKPNSDPKKGLLFNPTGSKGCLVLTVNSASEERLEEHDCKSSTSGFICQYQYCIPTYG